MPSKNTNRQRFEKNIRGFDLSRSVLRAPVNSYIVIVWSLSICTMSLFAPKNIQGLPAAGLRLFSKRAKCIRPKTTAKNSGCGKAKAVSLNFRHPVSESFLGSSAERKRHGILFSYQLHGWASSVTCNQISANAIQC